MKPLTESKIFDFFTGFGCGVLITVRFWFQGLLEITGAETRIHYLALQPVQWIITHTSGPLNQPPLHLILLNIWLRFTPSFSFLAHSGYGILVTGLALWLFYSWGRLFFNRRYSLFLVVLLAWNPYHFLYSSGFQIYSLFLVTVIAAGYFATKIIVFENYNLHNWLGWAVAALGAVYTHSFALVYVALLAGMLVWEVRRRPELSDCLLAIGAVLISYFPWIIHTGASEEPAGLEQWLQSDRVFENFVMTPGYFSAGTLQYLFVFGSLVLFLLLFSVALFALVNWRRRRVQLLALAGFLPFVLTGFYSLAAGGFFTGEFLLSFHLLIPALPFLILLFGFAIEEVEFKLSVVLFLTAVIVSLPVTGLLALNHSAAGWEKLAGEIRKVHENDVRIIHVHPESFYPVYYHNRHRLPEYHLETEKSRGVDELQLVTWRAEEGLLIIIPSDYNILRLHFIFPVSPDYIKPVSLVAGEYKLVYFPPD